MTLEELIVELGQLYLEHGNLNVGMVDPDALHHTRRVAKVHFCREGHTPIWNGPNPIIKIVPQGK